MQTSAEESLAAESDRHPSRDPVRLDVGAEHQPVQADTRDQALRPPNLGRDVDVSGEPSPARTDLENQLQLGGRDHCVRHEAHPGVRGHVHPVVDVGRQAPAVQEFVQQEREP